MKTNILNTKKWLVLALITAGIYQDAQSQDLHFSQYYSTPLIVNPALTGLFNGKVRGIANYRDQWSNVAPFKTYGLSVDAGLMKKKMDDAFLGAGLSVYQDEAGDSRLSTTQVNLSLSSIITINDNNVIAAGIQGGLVQKNIKNGDLQWGTQYDKGSHAPSLPSGEPSTYENSMFGDFSLGLVWNYGKSESNIAKNNHFGASAGFAIYHLNAPMQAFDTERLHRNFVSHAGLNIGIKGTPLAINPSVLYMQQGPLKEINAGGLIRYMIVEEAKYTKLLKETAIYLGAFYRVGDAIVPAFMFEYANYSIGVSYDINTSNLTDATDGKGGVELSFRYITPNPYKSGRGSKYIHRSLL